MTKEAAFTQQFIKQGMAYGLTEIQATTFFKQAAQKFANDWGQQLQGMAGQVGQFAQQNPAAAGAIGGGLGGAALGGMMGGGKGMMAGGAAGAGIGGAGGLAMDPGMQQKIMQMLHQGGQVMPAQQGESGFKQNVV